MQVKHASTSGLFCWHVDEAITHCQQQYMYSLLGRGFRTYQQFVPLPPPFLSCPVRVLISPVDHPLKSPWSYGIVYMYGKSKTNFRPKYGLIVQNETRALLMQADQISPNSFKCFDSTLLQHNQRMLLSCVSPILSASEVFQQPQCAVQI